MRHDEATRHLGVPSSTRDLLTQRAFVIDPWAWGHVSRRGHGNDLEWPEGLIAPNSRWADGAQALAAEDACTLPFREPKAVDLLSDAMLNQSAPYGVVRQCTRSGGTFDCSAVGDVSSRSDSPQWGCSAASTKCAQVVETLGRADLRSRTRC